MRLGVLLFFTILVISSLANCKFPTGNTHIPYSRISHPAAPEYSDECNWVALPHKHDAADLTPVDSVRDNQANADIDVFFIYPTIYNS